MLEADPDLGERMSPEARRDAAEMIRLRVYEVRKGPWMPPDIDHGSTGLLLLSGLMVRTLRLGTVASAELVGPTDIIRPWERDVIPSVVPPLTDWRVLEPVRVGFIDTRATALIGRWPELSAAVSGRMLRRMRSLAYLMAVQHFLRVEDRLLATLWHVAALWGRVTPRGTVIPFRLTQDTLADLIGARRPTTTTAVRTLTERGLIARDDDRRYVLLGSQPEWQHDGAQLAAIEV